MGASAACEPVTVVINNRNLLTWPKAMLERIEGFRSLAEVIFVDNASTYEPLCDWYDSISHKVIRTDNLGHAAPWVPQINDQIATDLYVVSDPDMDLSATPSDCLEHLAMCLDRFPRARKIGLGLDIGGVPAESPYHHHVNTYERALWELPLIGGLVRPAPVDTTFAIYRKSLMNEYKITGGRTDYPYVAGHIPWAVVERSDEFENYLATAGSSCSYKAFLNISCA